MIFTSKPKTFTQVGNVTKLFIRVNLFISLRKMLAQDNSGLLFVKVKQLVLKLKADQLSTMWIITHS